MATTTLTLSSKNTPFPWALAALASSNADKATLTFDDEASTSLSHDGKTITDKDEIVSVLSSAVDLAPPSYTLKGLYETAKKLPGLTAMPEITAALDVLDDHLAYRTFVQGEQVSAGDYILWGALKSSPKPLGLLKNSPHHTHLSRHLTHLSSLPPSLTSFALLTAHKSSARSSNKTAASFSLGLEGAVQGEVVTRFPPEPSGYLHIGHAKAAALNAYFAKMYGGKMIVRFDDTNPTKEKSEFEESILEDLRLLGIEGDVVTHTSDHFDTLHDLAVRLIKEGKAYADDTAQEEMRAFRMSGTPSARRDLSPSDSLARFEEMSKGTDEGVKWCIRAKMSVDDPNKAMRDPVIYRVNRTPHHRTGTKYSVYPTYDFACPVVDSIEGVTHALRTNEYRDRNPQYRWMIEALGLRGVRIWDFSRLNFIYTLLSKRKLHWFVDQGLVKGWDDPRFPTVRGIRRRGLTVPAIQQFMLAQGPSQAIVSLEWDSIWALNRKIIDPIAPRHWAIEDGGVPVTLSGGPATPEVKSVPRHKKDASLGERRTVYSSSILVEHEDAVSFEEGEEVTLMDWGNAIVRQKTIGADGKVTALLMDLYLEGDFKLTKKKITWLAQPVEGDSEASTLSPTPITLLDYDYLITKKKLEESDNLADFVTPTTEFRTTAIADANVLSLLQKGDVMQFERKGYFMVDRDAEDIKKNGGEGGMEFVKIPDGRAGSLASKAAGAPTVTEVAEDAGKGKKEKGEGKGKKGKGETKEKPKKGDAETKKETPKASGEGKKGRDVPLGGTMYVVKPILDEGVVVKTEGSGMYKVNSIHQ